MAAYGRMATGQNPLGLQSGLYAGSVCDDSATKAAYAAIVTLHK